VTTHRTPEEAAVNYKPLEYFVFVEKGRAAYYEQPYRLRARVFERVASPARDVNGIALRNITRFIPDRHAPATRKNVIDLFELAMMVRGDGASGREHLFGKAALSYLGRCAVDQRAQLGPVPSLDRARAVAVYDNHTFFQEPIGKLKVEFIRL
jgi:hypothetical protein